MSTSHRCILTGRDVAFLVDLFEARVMTTQQVSRLHFADRKESAYKRLQKLKAGGWIKERARHAAEPAVLTLTRRAWTELADRGWVRRYPTLTSAMFDQRMRVSDLTVRHELDVMEFKTVVTCAIRTRSDLALQEMSVWPAMHQFSIDGEWVKPDAFIRVRERAADGEYEHSFFVEIDRGTESLGILTEKAMDYRAHYASGGFAERQGAARDQKEHYPFAALFVVRSEERRDNFCRALLRLDEPILNHSRCAVFSQFAANISGPCWRVPADYQCDATPPTGRSLLQ